LTLDDGLFADSAVNCDRLMTVAKSVVAEYVTTLSDVRMALVEQAIRFALDFAD
jgi:mRNA-degrading endonuclease toxin of MazEF toxin-antitoxin module